jgi:hypothetical protein
LSIFKRKKRVLEVPTASADYKRYEAENPEARLESITGSPFLRGSDASIEDVEEHVEHRLGVEDDSTPID